MFPDKLTYKILKDSNPEYDENQLYKDRLLFKGGNDIIDNAKLFIKKGLESAQAYQAKLQQASYLNFYSNIINDYTSTLFSNELLIHPALDNLENKDKQLEELNNGPYGQFAADADDCGNSLNDVLYEVLTNAMNQPRAFLGVDFNIPNIAPKNKKEEKANRLDKPYVYVIPAECVVDWNVDDKNNLNYVVLYKISDEKTSINQSRNNVNYEYKIWEINDKGEVVYAIYQVSLNKNKELSDGVEFSLIDSGTTSFKQIPIVMLQLPSQLYINGLIGATAANIFDRYTSLLFAQHQSLMAVPFFTMGAEYQDDGKGGGDYSEIGSNPNRKEDVRQEMINRGFAVGGPDDKLEFVEPEGKSYEIVYKQIKDDIDRIYHIVNQMGNVISNNNSNSTRSAQSKGMDHKAKEHALSAYGNIIKQFALKVYKIISEAKDEDIVWCAYGLNNYHLTNRETLIKEAAQINLINIPSDTFKVLYLSELSTKLLETEGPGQSELIKSEIKKNIEAGIHQLGGEIDEDHEDHEKEVINED